MRFMRPFQVAEMASFNYSKSTVARELVKCDLLPT